MTLDSKILSAPTLPLLERAIVFYLILPLALFGFWLQWPVALVWWAAWGYFAWQVALPRKNSGNSEDLRRLARLILVALLVALCWALAGGLGHVLSTTSDWGFRDAVLRDLVAGDWPVSYGQTSDGRDLLLRCPLGFYLVPAALAKIFGANSANLLVVLWSALGVALLFASIANGKSPRATLGFMLLFIFFSGMDWAGYHITHDFNGPQSITEHLEWWALGFQYSSHSTLLFWVPNHALPGWLGLTLFYRYRTHPETLRLMPVVMVAAVFWSPLTGIGLAPFACLLLWEQWRQEKFDAKKWRSLLVPALAALVLAIPVVIYFGLDGSEIPGGWSTRNFLNNPLAFVICYISFVLLEFLLLAMLLSRFRSDAWLTLSAVILVLLPFYSFGPGNDLVMRGGIPALTLICLRTFEVLSTTWPRWLAPKIIAILFFLAIGAITPAHEIIRAFVYPAWPVLNVDLITIADDAVPPHYVARITREQTQRWLKPPVALPGRENYVHLPGNSANPAP